MKFLSPVLISAVLLVGAPALAMQPPASPAAAAPASTLTVASTVGALLDNPKTDAVLKKLIPTARGNEMFTTMGRESPLKDLAEYEPELTEAKLKELDVALAAAQK